MSIKTRFMCIMTPKLFINADDFNNFSINSNFFYN